jgi:hypothetical protein
MWLWADATWAWAREARLVGAYLLLGGLIVAGFAVASRMARWARDRPAPRLPGEELEHYRALKDEGEISPEEFERIRARLEGKPPDAPRHEPPA